MGRLIKARLYGFTLVELLIVVAIIGILATVGIPTFKKMTQKAKKSEAKVLLGGVFTAESAFQAEYGLFGNFLDKIGFEAGGGPSTYIVGFLSGACTTAGAVRPDSTTGAGSNLNSQYPSYYTDAANTALFKTTVGFTGGPTACADISFVSSDGTDFLASAQGVIAPSLPKSTANSVDLDIWTMSRTKTLLNTQDGVR